MIEFIAFIGAVTVGVILGLAIVTALGLIDINMQLEMNKRERGIEINE